MLFRSYSVYDDLWYDEEEPGATLWAASSAEGGSPCSLQVYLGLQSPSSYTWDRWSHTGYGSTATLLDIFLDPDTAAEGTYTVGADLFFDDLTYGASAAAL